MIYFRPQKSAYNYFNVSILFQMLVFNLSAEFSVVAFYIVLRK